MIKLYPYNLSNTVLLYLYSCSYSPSYTADPSKIVLISEIVSEQRAAGRRL